MKPPLLTPSGWFQNKHKTQCSHEINVSQSCCFFITLMCVRSNCLFHAMNASRSREEVVTHPSLRHGVDLIAMQIKQTLTLMNSQLPKVQMVIFQSAE